MNVEPWFILNSQYNCEFKYGLDPSAIPPTKSRLTADELKRKKEEYSNLITVTKFFMKKLLFFLKDTPTLIFISDDDGNVLEVIGDENLKTILDFKEGIFFDESYSGTNSISLCLKHKQPIQVKGDQHFFHVLYDFSCSTCMFSVNNLKGTISLMTQLDHSSQFHLGLISSAVDAIERELLLEENNKKLKLLNNIIIDVTKDGIIITDPHGKITKFNHAAENLTGYTYTEIANKSVDILEVLHPFMEKVLAHGEKFENIELTYPTTDGTEKLIQFDAFPIYDQNFLLTGCYLQFKDITEKRQLENQFIEAEKLSVVGKLSAGLAHEIRNPLTPILGFIQLLEEKHQDDELAMEYYNIIKSEIIRMKTLLNDFVLVSKPEVPQKKKTNISRLVRETVDLMRSQGTIYNIKLSLAETLSEDEGTLLIDKNQIKQTLINLIQNAMEEMNGGEINICMKSNNDGVFICIKDEGSGMSEDIKNKIFDPFFTTKDEGVGLGLSVCSRIIKNHQGTITVDSKRGSGTTFTIFLPYKS